MRGHGADRAGLPANGAPRRDRYPPLGGVGALQNLIQQVEQRGPGRSVAGGVHHPFQARDSAMKKESPSSRESCTRMLVRMSPGGQAENMAQTVPPACASTVFTPMARSSVLLPDMFEPVTSSNVPGGPS